MSVGFSAADFSIVPDGDMLPLPVKDEQGFSRYSATLQFASRTQLNTLLSYQSQIEIVPALGGGGTIIITGGAGSKTLTYPMQNNVEDSAAAILVTITPQVRLLHLGYIRADAQWILVQ